MNYQELKTLEELMHPRPAKVSINELVDKRDRTLIYGYTLTRLTHHVYLKDGKFHILIYRPSFQKPNELEVVEVNICDTQLVFSWMPIVPDKRAYPERCDFDFCKLLINKGAQISFTTYDESRTDMSAAPGFYGLLAPDTPAA